MGETRVTNAPGLTVDDPVYFVRHRLEADLVTNATLTDAPAADDHEEPTQILTRWTFHL
jgi:hypothetical protein